MQSFFDLLGSEVFWVAVGSVATVLLGVGALVRWVGGRIERSIEEAIRPIREENRRLREEIDTRLRMPSFALNNIESIERTAKLRVEEIERQRAEALRSNQEEHAQMLAERRQEIESLRQQLDLAETERSRLASELEESLAPERPYYSGNAVGLPTGFILVVRHQGKYGAVKAIDQASADRGGFIRYAWWYQPDGSGSFINLNTQTGYGETHDHVPGVPETQPPPPSWWPELEIGPIKLEWSLSWDGYGYVYFGTHNSNHEEYELAITDKVDISKVEASRLEFFRYQESFNPGDTPPPLQW